MNEHIYFEKFHLSSEKLKKVIAGWFSCWHNKNVKMKYLKIYLSQVPAHEIDKRCIQIIDKLQWQFEWSATWTEEVPS